MSQERARRLVKSASEQVQAPQARTWLLWDEKGLWERRACALLAQTAEHAERLGLSTAEVDTQISLKLGLEAIEALIRAES